LRLQIVLLVLKYIFDPALRDHLSDIFHMFRELSEKQTAVEYLRTVLYYIGNAARHLQREEMVTIIQQTLADEGGEVMETIAEQWIQQGVERGLQQGIRQGMRQGVIKGEEQGLRKAILDILLIRFDLAPREVEERLTAVTSADQLRDLHRQAVTVESLDDFTDLLPQD
jgi:flagellar biosynthesis/type III secretory pathway protein FliH